MSESNPMMSSRVKSLFIWPLFGLQIAALIAGLRAVVVDGHSFGWYGPLLSAGSFMAFMGFIAVSGRPRTSKNLPFVIAASAVGIVVTLLGAGIAPAGTRAPLFYGMASGIANFLYVFWYSRLGRRESPLLQVGRELPEFMLETDEGKALRSTEIIDRPTVFLFFRGNWCPLCMAQIREISDQYREIADRGAQVVLVSPQPHEKSAALAKKFDAPMRFMVDPGNRASRRLGIAHDGGLPFGMQLLGYDSDTVMPTLVVTDASGKVAMADQTDNYRVRPEPSTFLAALDAV